MSDARCKYLLLEWCGEGPRYGWKPRAPDHDAYRALFDCEADAWMLLRKEISPDCYEESRYRVVRIDQTPPRDLTAELALADTDIHSEHLVAGDRLCRPIYEHVRACEALIQEQQHLPLPDNAIIATLCDSVRMARELFSEIMSNARLAIQAMPVVKRCDGCKHFQTHGELHPGLGI